MLTSPSSAAAVHYTASRNTFHFAILFDELVARYEAAVPAFRPEMIAGATDWSEVESRAAEASANGFLIYLTLSPGDTMAIAGVGRDRQRSRLYLMGNHVYAESMYRHHPSVMLYAPLRVEIYEDESGAGVLSIDRPAPAFESFGDTNIAEVGRFLDTKIEQLVAQLGFGPARLG